MCIHKTRAVLLGLAFLLCTKALVALPADRDLPLVVTSDSVNINYAQGITTLIGHVVVTQGTTVLHGHKVIVTTDQHQKLMSVIAYGDHKELASYQTLPAKNNALFTATADKITYIEVERVAIFEGDAHATDGINKFEGSNFSYWPDKQEVITKKSNDQPSKITIFPHSSSAP